MFLFFHNPIKRNSFIFYFNPIKLIIILKKKNNIKVFKNITYILCSSYNLCDLLGPNTTECAPQLKSQNLPCHCPFQPGTYTLQPATFKVPEMSGLWSWLASVSIHKNANQYLVQSVQILYVDFKQKCKYLSRNTVETS